MRKKLVKNHFSVNRTVTLAVDGKQPDSPAKIENLPNGTPRLKSPEMRLLSA